ncbi:hypothetical protein ACMHYB_57140 [Sorangium sp. So ce1128]
MYERFERGLEEAGDVARRAQAPRAAGARGVDAPAELEGGEQPLGIVERELGPQRERAGRKAPEVQQAVQAELGLMVTMANNQPAQSASDHQASTLAACIARGA